MMQYRRIRLRVTGRVQGVGFRWFAVVRAERLDVRGWVRNARDGSVELEVEGPEPALEQLRRALAEGPPGARVKGIEELPAGSAELPDGFAIVR